MLLFILIAICVYLFGAVAGCVIAGYCNADPDDAGIIAMAWPAYLLASIAAVCLVIVCVAVEWLVSKAFQIGARLRVRRRVLFETPEESV